MEAREVAKLVESGLGVSDKIRALAAAGLPRAEIARALGKRYQHVRNVLEADKLHPPRTVPAVEAPPAGVEESGKTFGGSYRLSLEAGGVVRLAPELLAALQVRPGSVIIAEIQEDGLKLFSSRAAWDRVAALVRDLGIDPKRDLVAELLAERRAEAARDD
jgi:predicted transcriptional regulator